MQFNEKRSMDHIRQQLIFLSVSLSLRDITVQLTNRVLIYIEELDSLESSRFNAQEESTGALALLHSSVTDLQLVLASLANHAAMLDRLNPSLELRKRIFPSGSSYLIRKSGTGINDVITDLENIMMILKDSPQIIESNQIINKYEVQLKTVKDRLSEYLFLNSRLLDVLDNIDDFRIRTGIFMKQIRLDLVKIYGNNKKIINSHFLG